MNEAVGLIPGGDSYLGENTSGIKRILEEDDGEMTERKTGGRRKIPIEFIDDKSRRHITFSKRKAGIMKKAYELSTLTGTQVLLLVASETGHVYTFATPKLQPLITKPEGKNLIQACLNAPDPPMMHDPRGYPDNIVGVPGVDGPSVQPGAGLPAGVSPYNPATFPSSYP
eukprot:Ihof_evm14s77 gene=Ihof_evmTU14s77